jgi:hypothetical protein
MPKNERKQNERSNVRVLHFPTSSTTTSTSTSPADIDADSLADSIRKAWTQKSTPTRRTSISNPGLLRLANGKI